MEYVGDPGLHAGRLRAISLWKHAALVVKLLVHTCCRPAQPCAVYAATHRPLHRKTKS
jgi:hypothetical protein